LGAAFAGALAAGLAGATFFAAFLGAGAGLGAAVFLGAAFFAGAAGLDLVADFLVAMDASRVWERGFQLEQYHASPAVAPSTAKFCTDSRSSAAGSATRRGRRPSRSVSPLRRSGAWRSDAFAEVYWSLAHPRGNEEMSDKESVRKRINSFIQSKDGEENAAEITKLIKSVFDDFLAQGLTPDKAAEKARIEILSWKYLFRVRKSDFADLLAQIEKVCGACDFSRLVTPKVEVIEGDSGKVKIYFRRKSFQIQVPKGYQIQDEHLSKMSRTLEEFYFDNLDDFADRTLKATMTVSRLETLPRYDLWFE